jgi:hypothetical protein
MDKQALLDPESLESQDDSLQPNTSSSVHGRRRNGWLIYAFCLLTLIVGTAIGALSGRQVSSASFWVPSPVLHDISSSFHRQFFTQRYDGRFMDENMHCQFGRPEVNEAWNALGLKCTSSSYFSIMRSSTDKVSVDRILRIGEEDATEAGFPPNHVHVNPKYGGGFFGHFEGLHHLHCLVCVGSDTNLKIQG